MNDLELAKAINESGFPLQLGLKQLITGVPDWNVARDREHSTLPILLKSALRGPRFAGRLV
jgi:hypothetical protein